MFAITLDDGPAPNADAALAALKRKGAVATFFVNAKNQADLTVDPAAQELLKRIYADGHQIGSHTYAHSDLATLSIEAIWNEMQSNDDVIFSIIGVRPLHVRLPYLSGNQQVYNALGSWGYQIAGINLDTLDYTHSGVPTELRDNMDNFNTAMNLGLPSYISLNHDFTAQIGPWLEQMIDAIRARGLRIVTVAECLGSAQLYRNVQPTLTSTGVSAPNPTVALAPPRSKKSSATKTCTSMIFIFGILKLLSN